MHTSVRTTILDNSISGDKIFGGDINYVDQLVADEIRVPHSGGTGSGSIDGALVTVGLTTPIGALFAETIGAVGDTSALSVYDSGFVPRAYFATSAGRGYAEIWSTTEKIIRLSAWSHSYINAKFMIGKTTATQSSYIMEVEGGLYVDTLFAPYVTATTGIFNVLNFLHDASWIDLDTFYTDYDDNVVPIYTGLDARMYDGTVVTKAIDALAQIGIQTILSSDWDKVAQLGDSGGPTLDGLSLDNDLAVGGISTLTGGVKYGTSSDVLDEYHKQTTATATIQFGGLPITPAAYTIKWQRVGNFVSLYLPTWEANDTTTVLWPGNPITGHFVIDLSDTAFDKFWEELTSVLTIPGPHVASQINLAVVWHQTRLWITPGSKEIEFWGFSSGDIYGGVGVDWTGIGSVTSDKIKFDDTFLTIPGNV